MIDLFTKQERIFISFLIFGILVGSGIELYRSHFKTFTKTTQTEKIEDFEKQIHEKAALIDSLLDERTSSSNKEIFLDNKKILTLVNAGGKSSQAIFQIEINRATINELVQLPQIGPVIASRIVDYRNAHGEFRDIEELINIKGIGEKKLNTIRPYIYIKQN